MPTDLIYSVHKYSWKTAIYKHKSNNTCCVFNGSYEELIEFLPGHIKEVYNNKIVFADECGSLSIYPKPTKPLEEFIKEVIYNDR
jgi:hypothetical protein